jgi:restriction system protein
LLKQNGRFKRHQYRIKEAGKVIKKLSAFDGEYKVPQCLVYLRKINPYTFEELLLTTFQAHGFKIKRNKAYSGDGGIDGRIYDKSGNYFLIQAKRYCGHIKKIHLLEFEVQIIKEKAQGGFFIHTGKTSKMSLDQYRNSKLKILSGSTLVQFILCIN